LARPRHRYSNAKGLYGKYGFRPLIDDPLHLYFSLEEVRRAFLG